jgi:aldose 1-epimerase
VNSASGIVEIRSGDVSVAIDTAAGGRLASVRFRGSELLVTADASVFGWGSYVMAPFAGRIRNGVFSWGGVEHRLSPNMGPHAIHGTVFDTTWTVDVEAAAAVTLSCDLGPHWPFAGRVIHDVTLTASPDEAQTLSQRLTMLSTDGPMPAWVGWHPWWRRDVTMPARGGTGGEQSAGALTLSADWSNALKYQRDNTQMATGHLVPVGSGPWDDCFVGVEDVSLRWPGLVRVSLVTDARCLVVYDEPGHAICVEPQTAPPDAVNLDPGGAISWPGSPVTVNAAWTFHPDAGLDGLDVGSTEASR